VVLALEAHNPHPPLPAQSQQADASERGPSGSQWVRAAAAPTDAAAAWGGNTPNRKSKQGGRTSLGGPGGHRQQKWRARRALQSSSMGPFEGAPSRGLTAARKSLADVKRTRETRFSVKAARGRENGTHADMERGGRGERLLAYGSQQGAAEAASCSGACSTRNSEAAPQTRSNRYT
jgi:hypothetical protein